MNDNRVFSMGGDATMPLAPGSNKSLEKHQRAILATLISGRAKKIILLEGGSETRRERAEDFIAKYAALGIPGRRINGHAVEIG